MGYDPNRRNIMLKEEKTEVGNLVRLSYYGTKMKSNPTWMKGTKGYQLLGVITGFDKGQRYPIQVRWFHKHADRDTVHGYRELKIARR
jgi:hypothetical protein